MGRIAAILLVIGLLVFWGLLNYVYELNPKINPDDYQGRSRPLFIRANEVYGPSGWDDSRPRINGYDFFYTYTWNGDTLSGQTYIPYKLGYRLFTRVQAGEWEQIEVGIQKEQPAKSILLAK